MAARAAIPQRRIELRAPGEQALCLALTLSECGLAPAVWDIVIKVSLPLHGTRPAARALDLTCEPRLLALLPTPNALKSPLSVYQGGTSLVQDALCPVFCT